MLQTEIGVDQYGATFGEWAEDGQQYKWDFVLQLLAKQDALSRIELAG